VPSLAGKFLLAAPPLVDPNFARTVVLIVRHDEEGAFGLIINRPMKVDVGTALGDTLEAARESTLPLYAGGPCQGPVFVLHTDPTVGGEEPVSGVYVTTEPDAIETLLQTRADPFKLITSYSGWSGGQVENELTEGSWLVLDATEPDVFSADPNLWTRLHTRASLSKFVDPDRIPDDPSVN
jgi:putative transcriptional regulator